MRRVPSAPSLVPRRPGPTYVVLDDFGQLGRAYRETDPQRSDIGSVISDFLTGQYNDPVRVIAFDIDQGWSQDASAEVAAELQLKAQLESIELSEQAQDFIAQHLPMQKPLPLRLVRL